jgi:hypothetical protein
MSCLVIPKMHITSANFFTFRLRLEGKCRKSKVYQEGKLEDDMVLFFVIPVVAMCSSYIISVPPTISCDKPPIHNHVELN